MTPSAQFLKGATEAYQALASDFDEAVREAFDGLEGAEEDAKAAEVEAEYPYHAQGESLPPWALVGPSHPDYPEDTPWPENASKADYQAGWDWVMDWAPDPKEVAQEFID